MNQIYTGVIITAKQKEWLVKNGIKLSPIVRSLLEELIDGDANARVKDIVRKAWKIK